RGNASSCWSWPSAGGSSSGPPGVPTGRNGTCPGPTPNSAARCAAWRAGAAPPPPTPPPPPAFTPRGGYKGFPGPPPWAHSRLVAYIARRYLNRGVSPADLIQEGFCGLLEAIDRFDTINTTRLATYAAWWIRQALQRAIAGAGYPVRLSPRQLRRLAQSLSQ